MTLWGVIAGGRGLRFGQPKISAVHDGRTFIDLTLATIDEAALPGDHVAVGIANDTPVTFDETRIVVRDAADTPGPAHSIARLAECALAHNHDLVFMPVDMLRVKPVTLRLFVERLRTNRRDARDVVLVARSGERPHWVLGAVPKSLLPRIVAGGESVSAVQSLLRLCSVDHLEVDGRELLDVNTPDSLPVDQG